MRRLSPIFLTSLLPPFRVAGFALGVGRRAALYGLSMIVALAGFLGMSLLAPSPAAGNPILLGTDNPWNGASPSVENTQADAQAFTLTQSISVSSIDVWLYGGANDPNSPIPVQLTTSIGPGTTLANVVFSATIPGTSVPFPPGEVNIPASLSLGPGTYYLVLSSPGVANGYAWITAFNVLPSNVGAVGQGYYCCFPNPVGIFPPAETFKTLAGNIVAGPT